MMNSKRSLTSTFKLDDVPKEKVEDLFEDFKFVKSNKKIEYLNVPMAFDIESTSFTDERGDKSACMYCFVFGINGRIVVGRTWEEFMSICNKLTKYYCLDKDHRCIIYVHNLSFEFQWFRKRFEWEKVFALSEREVCYCLTKQGIEFRCSYILSGYSLAKLGEQCTYYPVQKMVGDLDYSLMRTSETPLTDKEWKYVYNDGLVVMSYIEQQIEIEGNITLIPLTKTGYVRRYCRNECLYEGTHSNSSKYLKYRKIIKSLTISSIQEYKQLKRAFIGGHSHGNPLTIGQTLLDVTSMDYISSYPYCMLSEQYPMSKGERIKITSKEQFYKNIDLYCCIFDVTFYNIESITPFEHFIPSSKCFICEGAEYDNGKIVNATKISMSLTEVDFKTISKFYKWDHIGVKNFRRYMKGYLPKNFILAILNLYKKKTELKGVDDMYIEYMQSKASLNASYGMTVTDICRDEVIYDAHNNWSTEIPDYEKMLTKYNRSKNRFLFYVWGLYVTAYAKQNLASGILELQYDYLYSDTDSVKFLNYDKHKAYFETYNKQCEEKLLKMLNKYHLNPALVKPKTIKGVEKLIGVWDYDGHYKRFRCLGSKRYMVELDDGTYSFTVAGCSKKKAVPYMIELAKKKNMDVMDLFDDDLYIPPEYTCKNIHTYIDYSQDGILKDYLGHECEYHELSSVNLEPCDFTLSLSNQFADYILGLRGQL